MKMKRVLYGLLLCLGFTLAMVSVAQRAGAVLGESADSVESDRKALLAVRGGSTVRDGYTVHELRSSTTVAREYVSLSGTVFGIAWNGLTHPDLTKLLGTYAGEYRAALRQTPHRHGQRTSRVLADRVVVETWGHIRNLQGRAYAPYLLPPGVSIDEIR